MRPPPAGLVLCITSPASAIPCRRAPPSEGTPQLRSSAPARLCSSPTAFGAWRRLQRRRPYLLRTTIRGGVRASQTATEPPSRVALPAVGEARKQSQGSVSRNGEAVFPAETRAGLGSRWYRRPPSLHPFLGTPNLDFVDFVDFDLINRRSVGLCPGDFCPASRTSSPGKSSRKVAPGKRISGEIEKFARNLPIT